jgi:hypothetical protein
MMMMMIASQIQVRQMTFMHLVVRIMPAFTV